MFWKKKKEDPIDVILKCESAFMDDYPTYYRLYTSCIREMDYDKVDNMAYSMYKAYNRADRIKEVYRINGEECSNDAERKYLEASEAYVIAGVELIIDILKDIIDFKDFKKEARKQEVMKESKDMISQANEYAEKIKEKLPVYEKRNLQVKELKKVRDQAFEAIN